MIDRSERGRGLAGGLLWALTTLVGVASTPIHASAQDLADLDYENLSFRGFGVEVGYLFPERVERTMTFGARFDLGYLGPGLRIVPGITYWASDLREGEVREFEDRLAALVVRQVGGPVPVIDLGVIEWSDLALTLDGHIVWEVPFDLLTFAGMGVGVHFFDGDGAGIDGTFMEDLLDTAAAGLNLHMGVEYPVTDRFRVYGQARYELMEEMQRYRLSVGWQVMTGPNAPGEGRR